MRSRFLVLSLLAILSMACSRQPTQVSIVLNAENVFGAMSSQATSPTQIVYDGLGALGVSETGLIKSKVCYFINVTAPDLNVSGTGGNNDDTDYGNSPPSCKIHDAPALGKYFGPYSYGDTANIRVPAGSNRRFDLVGFLNPHHATDSDCSRKFEIRLGDNPDGRGRKLNIIYGDYVIDNETTVSPVTGKQLAPEPFNEIKIFSRTLNAVNLAPGLATVNLSKIPWDYEEGDWAPVDYGCNDRHEDGDGGGGDGESPPPVGVEQTSSKVFLNYSSYMDDVVIDNRWFYANSEPSFLDLFEYEFDFSRHVKAPLLSVNDAENFNLKFQCLSEHVAGHKIYYRFFDNTSATMIYGGSRECEQGDVVIDVKSNLPGVGSVKMLRVELVSLPVADTVDWSKSHSFYLRLGIGVEDIHSLIHVEYFASFEHNVYFGSENYATVLSNLTLAHGGLNSDWGNAAEGINFSSVNSLKITLSCENMLGLPHQLMPDNARVMADLSVDSAGYWSSVHVLEQSCRYNSSVEFILKTGGDIMLPFASMVKFSLSHEASAAYEPRYHFYMRLAN